MGFREILEFVKIEHMLFSLPFVLIGALIAVDGEPSDLAVLDIVWILIAAVGARGLAMTLNRIIDKDVDAANPRTADRHLPSGAMSLRTAWALAVVFLAMLLAGAWQLNMVALQMAWLPVLAFVIYPYLKRGTWLCHFWLGGCLALAPAGAWLGIVGDDLGWAAITGFHWYPRVLLISMGVIFWIAAYDLNYSLMDVDSDRAAGIHSFPVRFGVEKTGPTAIKLTIAWLFCFAMADPTGGIFFFISVLLMAIINIHVIDQR
ncbi:MAG: putative 4-hydroxybenzoate polyprenyltransferase, partial [Candidatus Poseidoniales archaeon]|nr:putative 4-hydroxybenzoate polyprenyltransferase [Candidatus Poseidoniales archaeon]